MKNPEHAAEVLHQLKDQKISLALDDFGTGYSSLSYLQRFPIDIVKIDRSFISDIESNSSNHRIVEIITMLGKTLGLTVVAEGIEHQVQTEILREMGCQMGQGYLFSKPVPPDEALRLIAMGDDWLT
jgi:EAL domain-containing protein (putative c-di-GMP-specific phosphodiesterase class I)